MPAASPGVRIVRTSDCVVCALRFACSWALITACCLLPLRNKASECEGVRCSRESLSSLLSIQCLQGDEQRLRALVECVLSD